jgi:Cu(I)/Ag(I) efflux system periplasmic protein CusF
MINPRMFAALTVAAMLAVAAVPAGAAPASVEVAQAKSADAPKVFHGVGVVTATKPAGTLTINHEAIEGLMPAMEMTFAARPASITKGVRTGDRVQFTIDGRTDTLIAVKVVGHHKSR